MPDSVKPVTITFEADVYDALLKAAIDTGRSLSDLVNDAVRSTYSEDLEDPDAFDRHFSDPQVSFEAFRRELTTRRPA